jgi:hypothetical protein
MAPTFVSLFHPQWACGAVAKQSSEFFGNKTPEGCIGTLTAVLLSSEKEVSREYAPQLIARHPARNSKCFRRIKEAFVPER